MYDTFEFLSSFAIACELFIFVFSSFRAQLIEANSKVTNLNTETDQRDKKHGYDHDKQLEELRNLQVKHTNHSEYTP